MHFDRQINVLSIIVAKTNEIKNDKNIIFHFYVKYKKFESKNKIYKLFKHVTNMFEISIEILFYQRKFTSKLMKI